MISKLNAKLAAVRANKTGSDTVEKLGMIVAAVVIIALVLFAINHLFGGTNGIVNTIVNKTNTKFNAALDIANVA